MSMLWRVFVLLLLCAIVYSHVVIASEIEVALGADGSIIDGDRPLEAGTKGADTERHVTQATSTPNEVDSVAGSMETKEPINLELESDVVVVVTTLQRELAAVEQMVKLQEKKLQVLREMRSVWLKEQTEVKLPEEGGMGRRRRRVDVGEAIDRKLDAAIAESVATLTARDFDTYFVERASVELDGEVVDMKMTEIRAGRAVELIAVAYKDGVVVFYTLGAEELLRVDTGRKGIEIIALELQNDQPCLIVTYETPVVAIYGLKLVENNGNDAEVRADGQELNAEPSLLTISVRPEYLLTVSEHRDLQLSAKASAVAIARSSRQLVLAVAQADGIINFLALNGTSLRQVQTNASISAIETRRNILAFSNGTNIVVSSMTRAQGFVFHTCPGSAAQVSSIAFHAMQPEIMYAGTQRGEVLVYAVNAGAPTEVQTCRLLSRSIVTKGVRGASPVVVATTKMYVIAAGPQGIAVFNVSKTQRSGVSLTRMCSTRLSTSINLTEDHLLHRQVMVFSDGVLGSHLAVVTAGINGQSKLSLFHSLLPDERDAPDFQWTVFVYVGVAIVAVVGSQLFFRWQKQSSVNPWDSIAKSHKSPYDLKDHDNVSEFDGEDFGRYNSLSDELRRKITQAKKASARRAIDDDADY